MRCKNHDSSNGFSEFWPMLTHAGKPHLLSKLENRKTTLDNKTEKPLLFSTKTENRMLKNQKSANRNEDQNRKTFWHKNRKTDLKNCQNRKTENPNLI